MSELLSSITGGGGGLPKLAPDLTRLSQLTNNTNYVTVTIDPTGALTTAISLTGKYAIDLLQFSGLVNEEITIEMTIDSVPINTETYTITDNQMLMFGGISGAPSTMQCDTSLLIQIETITANVVLFDYIARPIL